MGADQKLIEAAIKLVEAAHKELDQAMPERLAGIVKLHAALSVGAAWIPVPGVGLVAGGAAVWSMYYRINSELNMPFSENVLKSVASGVGTNLAGYVGFITAAELLKFIPGIGWLAAGVMLTAVAYALTLASGWVYMNLLTLLLKQKNAENITESDWKNAISQVMNDKAAIQSFLSAAKASYKKQNVTEQEDKTGQQGGTKADLPSWLVGNGECLDSQSAACPKCGFLYGWDGKRCRHCRYEIEAPASELLDGHLGHATSRANDTPRGNTEKKSTPSISAEMIRFPCPGCGKRLKAPSGTNGRKARCTSCGQKLVIPNRPQGQ